MGLIGFDPNERFNKRKSSAANYEWQCSSLNLWFVPKTFSRNAVPVKDGSKKNNKLKNSSNPKQTINCICRLQKCRPRFKGILNRIKLENIKHYILYKRMV